MHIIVHCPGCYSRYQLNPQMQGQQIRCTNPVCRIAFEVRAESEVEEASIYPLQPPEPTPATEAPEGGNPPPQQVLWSGSVGDLVPILEAEAVPEDLPTAEPVESALPSGSVRDILPVLPAEAVNIPEVEAPREAPSWQQPPPIRKQRPPAADLERTASRPPATLGPEEAAPPLAPDSLAPGQEEPPPRESKPPRKKAPKTMMVPPGEALEPPGVSWEPPPVRRPLETIGSPESVPANDWLPPMIETDPDVVHAAGARRRSLWIIAVLSGVVIGLISAGGFMAWRVWHKTEGDLHEQARREYDEGKFALAAKTFTKLAKDFPNSESLTIYQFFAELSDVRNLVYSSDPQPEEASEKLDFFLEERRADELLKEHKTDVWETLLKVREGLTDLAQRRHDRRLHGLAKAALEKAQRYAPAVPKAKDRHKHAADALAQTETTITGWEVLQQLLAEGKELLQRPSDETVQNFRGRVQKEQLDQEGEVRALLSQLDAAVRQLIKYVEAPKEPTAESPDLQESSLVIAPLVGGSKTQPPANERVFLALWRGVLYALAQSNGEVLWATRVGIDTTTLPVRLPVTPTSPEMFLVVSADRNTLRALEARTGQLIWQHQLEQPCLGRPVVVRNRTYVPTYDGKVHEIEIVEGRRLGYFDLGQPLTVGGTWQPGTDLLYFPGDSRNLYVLSIADGAKGCVAILKSGHPSGSLRSEPIVINRSDPLARLPINQNAACPSILVLSQADGLSHMKLRVFELPITQPDATPMLLPEPRVPGWSWFQPYHDAEKLAFATDAGVLGLFGINQVRNEDTALYRELANDHHLGGDSTQLRRAQVVHADEQDFWVLANGELQQLQLDRFNQKMIPLWDRALQLGLPLHASRVDETGQVLCVVTQSSQQQGCFATAVDAISGQIVWQRQLGVEVYGEPLVVGTEVWILDRRSNLFSFDPRQAPRRLDAGWQEGGRLVAAAAEEGPSVPILLRGVDGQSTYILTSQARRLLVRRYEGGEGNQPATVTKWELVLMDRLGGLPCLTADSLLLPLANGSLHRFRLPLDGSSGEGGLDWRVRHADEGAPGYVVHLQQDEYLFTDGSNGLTRLHWDKGPNPKSEKPVLLRARIVAPPVVLRLTNPKDEVWVCVADADGVLTLLSGPELAEIRQWRLGGKITAGPFLRGDRIGCVVDQVRLVWLDPASKEPLWQYTLQEEGTQGIVGQPQLVGDSLLVADLSGRIVSLDPVTGRPRGPVYTLQASAAPAATPVAFGPDQALVPLSDGTIFLLPLAYVRQPAHHLPPIW